MLYDATTDGLLQPTRKGTAATLRAMAGYDPNSGHSASADDRLLLTAGQVAKTLVMSERALRRGDKAERVPEPVRIGRNLRWRASELAAWIDAGCPPRDVWTARWRAQANGR